MYKVQQLDGILSVVHKYQKLLKYYFVNYYKSFYRIQFSNIKIPRQPTYNSKQLKVSIKQRNAVYL